MIAIGGYDPEPGLKTMEETGQLIGYDQLLISNVSPLACSTRILWTMISVLA